MSASRRRPLMAGNWKMNLNHLEAIALTQKLRRIVDEGAGYGLALEGISAADVARSMASA